MQEDHEELHHTQTSTASLLVVYLLLISEVKGILALVVWVMEVKSKFTSSTVPGFNLPIPLMRWGCTGTRHGFHKRPHSRFYDTSDCVRKVMLLMNGKAPFCLLPFTSVLLLEFMTAVHRDSQCPFEWEGEGERERLVLHGPASVMIRYPKLYVLFWTYKVM